MTTNEPTRLSQAMTTSAEEINSPEMTVDKEVVDRFSEPTFIYETQRKMEMEFESKKQQYILKQSQKLGINPLIVIQQTALIHELKSELAKKESALRAVLAIPFRPNSTGGDMLIGVDVGRNLMLADVRQTIEWELNNG
jgi:hypothetical protein